MLGTTLPTLCRRSSTRVLHTVDSKRTSQYPDADAADEEAAETPEQTLIEAGFRPTTAAVLAGVNRWLFLFTVLVSGAALLWIGVHLWPDLDAAAWQEWADANPAFFAPLDNGSTIGIVPDLHAHVGVLITKEDDGLVVERRLWFPFDDVPIGLVVAPEAAESWLRLAYDSPDFWRRWQAIADDGGVHLYENLRRGSPHAEGYRAFVARLRSAGVE